MKRFICTKCKTILRTTNMKMSANRTYKILMYLNQRPYFCCIPIYPTELPPKIVIEMFSPEII